MDLINLFVVGFGRPDLLREQHRLLGKYLEDAFLLKVLDNTPDEFRAGLMEQTCRELNVPYQTVNGPKNEHHEALALATRLATNMSYWGCLDHDIFPFQKTSLIDKINQAGFFGMGQAYTPRYGETKRYLWPGWVFFSQEWLYGRAPNFDGIRGEFKFDDGDCGSMLHSLFNEQDWVKFPHVEHVYGTIREEDGHGLQSFGYEQIGDFIHLTNASHWKQVPESEQRDQMLREMIAAL